MNLFYDRFDEFEIKKYLLKAFIRNKLCKIFWSVFKALIFEIKKSLKGMHLLLKNFNNDHGVRMQSSPQERPNLVKS